MPFGDRLKELRKECGITQKELGDIIHVSDRVVGYYESNNRFPKDEDVLRTIADYFNVSVDYLVGRTMDGYVSVAGLPPDAVRQIDEYIDLIKLKYKT